MEMDIQDTVPTQVEFIDENDVVQKQTLKFEWQPVQCEYCHMLGNNMLLLMANN